MAKAAKKETKEQTEVGQLPAIQQGQSMQTIEARKQQADWIIEEATHSGREAMQVVDKCGLSKQISGKKYLETEGWLMIAEFAHVRAVIEWVRPWMDNNELFGYEARCQLLNDDEQVVGAGESSCGFDAFPCKGKQGSEKDKAAKAAAQTWAISRALRNKFSYVAKIAGYQAVPAEEMPRDETASDYQAWANKPRPDFDPPKSPQGPQYGLKQPQQLSKAHIDLKAEIEQYVKENHDHGLSSDEEAFAYILKELTKYDTYIHKTDKCLVCNGSKCKDCNNTGRRRIAGYQGATKIEDCSDAMAGAALRRFRERLAEKARQEKEAKAGATNA